MEPKQQEQKIVPAPETLSALAEMCFLMQAVEKDESTFSKSAIPLYSMVLQSYFYELMEIVNLTVEKQEYIPSMNPIPEYKTVQESIGIKLGIFRKDKKNILLVVRGPGLSRLKTSVQEELDVVRKFQSNNEIKITVYNAVIRLYEKYGFNMITGHGIGGMYAEYYAAMYKIAGIGFCNPGQGDLMQNQNRQHNFYNLSVVGDQIGNVSSDSHYCPVIPLCLLTNPQTRNHADLHSLTLVVMYFNRHPCNLYTNTNIVFIAKLGRLAERKALNANDDTHYLFYYDATANLALKGLKLTLYVIDLTTKPKYGQKIIDSKGLQAAMNAINKQIDTQFSHRDGCAKENHVDCWWAWGKLFDFTANFEEIRLLTTTELELFNTAPDTIAREVINYIVNKTKEAIDWKKCGFIFLTDDGKADGSHSRAAVNSFDIPFAMVKVKDEDWTVNLSHEVLELLADPWGMRFIQQTQFEITVTTTLGGFPSTPLKWPTQDWIIEVCDPVQGPDCCYFINKVKVSDFVLPSYFNITEAGKKLNYGGGDENNASTTGIELRRNTKKLPIDKYPFPVWKGGYLPCFHPQTNASARLQWLGTDPVYDDVSTHICARLSKYTDSHANMNDVMYLNRRAKCAQFCVNEDSQKV